jgi:hypothetical protein
MEVERHRAGKCKYPWLNPYGILPAVLSGAPQCRPIACTAIPSKGTEVPVPYAVFTSMAIPMLYPSFTQVHFILFIVCSLAIIGL